MTTRPDELTPGVPRSVPPPIAVAHMNEETAPLRRGVRRETPVAAPPAAEPARIVLPWPLRDLAGAALVVVGLLGGDVVAFAYAGPAVGSGLLCALVVLAGLGLLFVRM